MASISWPAGPPSFYADVFFLRKTLLNGTVLTVDPSSGSVGSMPGFAVHKQGKLVKSGIIEISLGTAGKPALPHRRFLELFAKLRAILPQSPDVLLVEQIGTKVHHLLLEAVGVTIVGANTPNVIRVHNQIWKAFTRAMPGYVKGDSADALAMAEVTMLAAKLLDEKQYDEFPEEALKLIKPKYR